MVDEDTEKEDAIGLVLPHAGYVYSGAVAGAAISRIRFRDVFVIIGPNHTGRGKPFSIMTEGTWKTPLGSVAIDSDLARNILRTSSYLEEDSAAHEFEHSIEVQLPFLQFLKSDVKIVPIVFGYGSGDIYQNIGYELARTVLDSNKEAVIIASSDMTHYESQESANTKDKQAIDAISSLDEDLLLKRVTDLDISMCGYGPAISLIAAARDLGAKEARLVRYQTSGDAIGDFTRINGHIPSPLVRLARKTVETYVREGTVIEPDKLTSEMKGKAGVFVSIHKFDNLRGCIGTFEPTEENIAREIIRNAINSATTDPRFLPIAPNELKDLEFSVDVLTRPERGENKDKLDPKIHGLIVECDYRRGLLLPDLEGVDTVEQQLSICCQKAGIAPGEPIKLYRFEVKRYT
jgi:AmmeMemoRadiSam system protein B/AmmeMemoRadiSam system protein A